MAAKKHLPSRHFNHCCERFLDRNVAPITRRVFIPMLLCALGRSTEANCVEKEAKAAPREWWTRTRGGLLEEGDVGNGGDVGTPCISAFP